MCIYDKGLYFGLVTAINIRWIVGDGEVLRLVPVYKQVQSSSTNSVLGICKLLRKRSYIRT